MAVAVIGGLITSTLLSLLVIPPVFTSVDDLGQWFGRMLRRLRGLHPVRAPGVSPTPEAPPATH